MATPLRFNPNNPVTAGIWRVPWGDGFAVRKRIQPPGASTHPDWQASDDPRHFLYWRREDRVYTSGLDRVFAGHVRAPRLLDRRENADGSIDLWLEALTSRSGAALTTEDHLRLARALGRAQGALDGLPAEPWLAAGVMRQLCASKHYEPAWLDRDQAWAHPLVQCWPAELRSGLAWLEAHREDLHRVLERAPRTLCHHDVWAHNAFVGDQVVLVDWAFVGEGALGEDLGHLVAEAGLNQLLPAQLVPALGESVLRCYLAGLHDVGWDGDEQAVTRAFRASAVKWHWLGPLHLQRAVEGGHHDYGGVAASDPVGQYRARGEVLAWAVRQAQRAL